MSKCHIVENLTSRLIYMGVKKNRLIEYPQHMIWLRIIIRRSVPLGRNTGGVNQLFQCLFNFNTIFIKFLMVIYDLHRCVMVKLPQVPVSLKSVRSV